MNTDRPRIARRRHSLDMIVVAGAFAAFGLGTVAAQDGAPAQMREQTQASLVAQAPPPKPAPVAGNGRGGDRQQQAVIAANQQADAAFQRADRNGDGRLSRGEVEHLPEVAARFEMLDVNRDQQISRAEFNRVLP